MRKQVFLYRTLGYDDAAQRQLIDAAYESGDESEIVSALLQVATVRRMKSSGVFDLLSAFPEYDADDDSDGSDDVPVEFSIEV